MHYTRGYVTLFMECFKLGMRLPLQPYFVQILRRIHLAPCQLNPNGRRLLFGLFILWNKCGQSEPIVDEIKHLFQLKSSPKDADWYYSMSSTKARKSTTEHPTGGGNWKSKFFLLRDPGVRGHLPMVGMSMFLLVSQFQVAYQFKIFLASTRLVEQVDSNAILICVANSWSINYNIKSKLLKRVEVASANIYSCNVLLSTRSLVDWHLVLDAHDMEDSVIWALNRRRPRFGGAKGGPNKYAP